MENKIKVFENRQVRTAWNADEEEWYFAVVDIIEVLTDSPNPQVYWRVLKKRLKDEGSETVTSCNALKMLAKIGFHANPQEQLENRVEIHLHKSFPLFWKKRERKGLFSFPQGSKADSAKASKHRDIRWFQSVYRDRLLLLPKSSQNSKSSILFFSRKGIAKKIFHTNMADSVIIIKRRRISTFYNALIHPFRADF